MCGARICAKGFSCIVNSQNTGKWGCFIQQMKKVRLTDWKLALLMGFKETSDDWEMNSLVIATRPCICLKTEEPTSCLHPSPPSFQPLHTLL